MRPLLPIGAPGPILKMGVMIFSAPLVRGQDDSGPDDGASDPQLVDGDRETSSASGRRPPGSRCPTGWLPSVPRRHGPRNSRSPSPGRRLADGHWACLIAATSLLGAVDATVADLGLHRRIPSLGEHIMAGQVDDRIAAVDLILPAARRRRVALDHLIGPHLRVAADLVRLPGQDHRLVPLLQQGPSQLPADQPRTPS